MWTARSCTRFAIEPGKRWIAGRRRNTGSRSASASVAASIDPRRSLRSSGPANAFWTVICWSSTKPTSRAIGSVAMRRFASSESVKWSWSGMQRSYRRSSNQTYGHEQPATLQLGRAVVDLEVVGAKGGQCTQVPEDLRADPRGVPRALDAPDRDHVVDGAEVAVELGYGVRQEPRLDARLDVGDQRIHRQVLGVLRRVGARLDPASDAHRTDADRKVVVDVRVHAGERVLDRRDVPFVTGLEERLPGVVRKPGRELCAVTRRVEGGEVRTGEVQVERREERLGGVRLVRRNRARDLEVEPVEPPDPVVGRKRPVELLHPGEDVGDRHGWGRVSGTGIR